MNLPDKTLFTLASVVVLMAVGQLLFKSTAMSWQQHGTLLAPAVAWRLMLALAVYGVATIAWIWVLRHAPLSMVYPLMALTFVLVPIGALWLFGEEIDLRFLLGTGLIVAGIVLANWPRSSS